MVNNIDFGDSPFAVLAKYQKFPPVSLKEIAGELGLNVYSKDLGPEISGQIMRDRVRGGKSGFAIFVNSNDHPNRQRFTLAHEIAHYILHRDLIEGGVIDDTMYRSSLSNYYEMQANKMAADILMPIRLVKQYMTKYTNVGQLAQAFEVSKGAMEIRLKSVGQITPPLPKQQPAQPI